MGTIIIIIMIYSWLRLARAVASAQADGLRLQPRTAQEPSGREAPAGDEEEHPHGTRQPRQAAMPQGLPQQRARDLRSGTPHRVAAPRGRALAVRRGLRGGLPPDEAVGLGVLGPDHGAGRLRHAGRSGRAGGHDLLRQSAYMV